MLEKIQALFKKGKHRQIEIFATQVVVLFVVMVGVVSYGGISTWHMKQKTLATIPIVSTEFATSRTELSGSVKGVYSDKSHKKAFVLLKIDKIDKMSLSAKNYQAFITQSKTSPNNRSKQSLSGSIYVFGDSGYFGLYLTSANVIKPQILDVVIRANSELISVDEEKVTNNDIQGDSSFKKHDQFRFYVNPGASKTKTIDALESDDLSITDLYTEMVMNSGDESLDELKTQAQNTLKQMYETQSLIDEYESRLSDTYDLRVPTRSNAISGDVIERTFNENNEPVYSYQPKYVYAGGYDFDFAMDDDFYFDDVLKGEISEKRMRLFLQEKDKELKESKKKAQNTGSGSYNKSQWVFKDGTALNDKDKDDSRYESIFKDAQLYEQYVTQYESLKRQYQTEILRKLLVNEHRAFLVSERTSVHMNEDGKEKGQQAVLFY